VLGTRVALAVAPAAGALLLISLHAQRALGARRAAGELLALALYLLAAAAIAGPGFAPAAAGWVALAITLTVALASLSLGARMWWLSRAGRSLSAGLLSAAAVLGVAPTAASAGLWPWPPGAFLGRPGAAATTVFVLVFSWTLAAELGYGHHPRALGRRAGLILGGLAWVAGLRWAWTHAGAGAALPPDAVWAVWGLAWGVPALLALTGRAALLPESLGGLLGSAGSRLPSSALILVLGTTLAGAAVLGDPFLAVSAAGPLLPPLALLSERPPLDRWRGQTFARLSQVHDFAAVLMKPRNGVPWTDADRAFLRQGVRTLARWTPGFVLFLLPGGLVLLTLYAWLLDRRHGQPAATIPRRRNSDAG
jgi:hypothetical protein